MSGEDTEEHGRRTVETERSNNSMELKIMREFINCHTGARWQRLNADRHEEER